MESWAKPIKMVSKYSVIIYVPMVMLFIDEQDIIRMKQEIPKKFEFY